MATSRTGTSRWKRIRAQAIADAIRDGLDKCPLCGTLLDLHGTGDGAPVEVDHVIPHVVSGVDDISGVQVMCKTCNRRKGSGQARKPHPIVRAEPPTLIQW